MVIEILSINQLKNSIGKHLQTPETNDHLLSLEIEIWKSLASFKREAAITSFDNYI